MKVTLIPGAGAVVRLRTPEGLQEIDVDAIEITPFFHGQKRPAVVLHGEVDVRGISGEYTSDRFNMMVSAVKGTISSVSYGGTSATPAIESKQPPTSPAGKPDAIKPIESDEDETDEAEPNSVLSIPEYTQDTESKQS